MPSVIRLLAACVAVSAFVSIAAAAEQKPAKPLNVLLLFSDDQRHDTLHALGNEQIKTPQLDRLVERGFAFSNNYVMGGMHGAICAPSRAMLHSGQGLWHVPENLNNVATLGETLQRAGYTTYGTGKWHNGGPSFLRSFNHGKNVFFGGMSDHFKVPVQDKQADGTFSPRRIGEKFSSELFADAAIEFLKGHQGDQPFFVYVSFTAPHDPRTPPGEYATMYDPAKIRLPKNFLPEHPFDNGELRVRDENLAPHPRSEEVVRQHIADYYGMISHLDEQIGRILAALHQTGRERDTLVIFAADNGLAVGQHGLLGKQNLYEHSAKMPLVLIGPGVPQGKSEALVYLYDLFPTICQAAGAATENIDGRSLWPVVRGQQPTHREHILGVYRDVQRSLREPRFKLIEYHVGGQRTTQLFDLAADPWEMTNLAGDPAHAETLARLRAKLKQARAEAGDPIDFDGVGGKATSAPKAPKAKK